MVKRVVDIPEELFNDLGLAQNSQLEIQNVNNQYVIKNDSVHEKKNEKFAFRYAMITGGLAVLIALGNFLFQHTKVVGLTGANSLTQITIYLGTFFGVIGFMVTLFQQRKELRGGMRRWINLITLTIAYGLIGYVILALMMRLISSAFAGACLDIYTMSIIIGSFVGIMSYAMVVAGQRVQFERIISILIATLFGGVVMSMATNGSAGWWQHNFSYLGTNNVGNGWIFNFTLIFSALILLTILDYLFSTLNATIHGDWRLFILRVLFSLTAIAVGAIGLFPNNPGLFHRIHDDIAQCLVSLVLVMIAAVRWLLPKASWEFLIVSYALAGGLVVSDILFSQLHYLSLTAFEMIAFGFAFTWLILLLQILRGLASTTDVFKVTVETNEEPDEIKE
ncbi:DUF998 domain-containing protein [Weissella kandleri]|uniref:DUF998 domain-containing protein n=1 Tax=Weissella kandleri TaxID=1616 RepID=UPI00387E4663